MYISRLYKYVYVLIGAVNMMRMRETVGYCGRSVLEKPGTVSCPREQIGFIYFFCIRKHSSHAQLDSNNFSKAHTQVFWIFQNDINKLKKNKRNDRFTRVQFMSNTITQFGNLFNKRRKGQ